VARLIRYISIQLPAAKFVLVNVLAFMPDDDYCNQVASIGPERKLSFGSIDLTKDLLTEEIVPNGSPEVGSESARNSLRKELAGSGASRFPSHATSHCKIISCSCAQCGNSPLRNGCRQPRD
jgi:hypothetical protein